MNPHFPSPDLLSPYGHSRANRLGRSEWKAAVSENTDIWSSLLLEFAQRGIGIKVRVKEGKTGVTRTALGVKECEIGFDGIYGSVFDVERDGELGRCEE